MMQVIIALFLLYGLCTREPTKNHNMEAKTTKVGKSHQEWWKTAVFYQIYPLSFMDSNNDGTGDLKGIIAKIDYVRDLGVTGLWLSPIFQSPMVDSGYDISDYMEIEPIFGTMEDFDELVHIAKKKGLRVILDFVPNHSSDQHEWFKKSSSGDEKYKDYYVWREGRNNNTEPPNNWISQFHGSVWSFHPSRQLWYLHIYASAQPELNFRNPAVIEEMSDIITFWLDKGVDGFRIDTARTLFEDKDLRDEAPTGTEGCRPNDRCSLNTKYQQDLDETFDMIYQWRDMVDEYVRRNGGDERIMMTESYSPLDQVVRYYGNADGSRLGAHFSFNAQLMDHIKEESDAENIQKIVDDWFEVLNPMYTSNWIVGSHDHHRLATRYGVQRSDGIIMLQMVLPGVVVTYAGEEIAMEDGEVSWEQGRDPRTLNDVKEKFAKESRDFERTPMQWDKTINAGFNLGHETWLPVSQKHVTCNVQDQALASKSHLQLYRKLIKLRASEVLKSGSTQVLALSKDVLQVIRSNGTDHKMLLFNVSRQKHSVDLSSDLPNLLQVEVVSTNSNWTSGSLVSTSSITLQPYEAIIYSF